MILSPRHLWAITLLACFAAVATAFAFNGHVVTEGPLTVTIADIPTVTAFDQPQSCNVTLANSGATDLAVSFTMSGLVDDCRSVGETERRLTVPARGKAQAAFQFTCGRRTHSAHYPVHVTATFAENGATRTAHAVQIFVTDFSSPASPAAKAAAAQWPVHQVPVRGALALTPLAGHRTSWAYTNGDPIPLPIDWTGSDATSAASFSRGPVARGGESRPALHMHPPYRPRAGTVYTEYRLRLPAAKPIGFAFCNAIRDSGPTEGKSDGVTFRVWANGQKLFERHTDAKTWTPGEADLSAFAGEEIVLRLESHPGPKNNTSCDSSYWGDPVITIGNRPALPDTTQREALLARARQTLESGRPAAAGILVYELEGGCRAVVAPGPNGLADGAIGFGAGSRQVVFSGLHLAVRDQTLGAWPSAAPMESVQTRTDASGRTRIVHRFILQERSVELTAAIWKEGPALRIKVECPEYVTGIALNAADQRAPRVYYGHGYCIVDPQPFRANAGGHNLSTSHVGFDFERGVSLLTASDTPPDHLQVDADRRIYRLHTHPDATLTFVPGFKGAFDCAVRYRPLYDKRAAAGVAQKAGRFVFDLWGGRYADHAARLARCFDYGLTDSLVMLHTWQRWGYDYRLPDIFPPLPSLGTLADLQELGRLCTARGALWGLHDNYIDIYPDADGFTYDLVTFTADGKPRKAWLNEGRNAQSYQFRPDRFQPFLRRNLDLIVPALRPTSSFVDVFASMPTFDFHDRAAKFHSKLETQRAWSEAFATIRNACGNNAPTVSEAGGDYLIGWLDGSDAQFMQLGDKPERFHNVVKCADWARVPWFDAVNHTRFSLHGVGYSDRYQGGHSREEHGIESDDYLTAELLTGHALMMDLAGGARGAVRKHWLAQDFIARIARDEIVQVEFAGGDIHRLVVQWQSGARVYVNRGETDWMIEGHTLPRYGYWARNGEIESSVERVGGAIVERSRAPGKLYGNARVFDPAAPLAIAPAAQRVEHLGGREMKLIVNWDAQRPTSRDLTVFYHFTRPTPGRRTPTEFIAGGVPTVPTSKWTGRVVTGEHWKIAIPANMPLGEYDVLVGLYDPRNRGARERLQGDEDARRRYRIGKLVIEGTKEGEVTGVRLIPPAQPFTPSDRWLANTGPARFGPVTTTGAVRCETKPESLVITPLPDLGEFDVAVRIAEAAGRGRRARGVQAIDARGAAQAPVSYRQNGDELVFRTSPGVFAYRIDLQ